MTTGDFGEAIEWLETNTPHVPASLLAYLGFRTNDVPFAVRSLSAPRPSFGLWFPVVGEAAQQAGLSPCRFNAMLLLRMGRHEGISAVVAATAWSVTLTDNNAAVDVEWQSETLATALRKKPIRCQVDVPFLPTTMIVHNHEWFGSFARFHCRDGADDN